MNKRVHSKDPRKKGIVRQLQHASGCGRVTNVREIEPGVFQGACMRVVQRRVGTKRFREYKKLGDFTTSTRGFVWFVKGKAYDCVILPRNCPKCGVHALVGLPKPVIKAQPDETNIVCHPAIGGCNHGFFMEVLPSLLAKEKKL